MNNHQNRKTIGFIFPILALGLMVLHTDFGAK